MKKQYFKSTGSLILLLIVFLQSCNLDDAIHLSPDGDDGASGSSSNPFKTLARAQSEVRERAQKMEKGTIRVVLHEGVYNIVEPLVFSDKDRVNEAVTVVWQAAKGEKPIVSGAQNFKIKGEIGELIKVGYADSDKLFDIYVNEKRAIRARTPNRDFFRFEGITEEVLVQGEGRSPEKAKQNLIFTDEAAAELQGLSQDELSKVRFHAFFKWDNTIRYLSELGEQKNSFITQGEGMKPWNAMGKDTRFFLENYRAALDAPNEWYGSGDTIEYMLQEEVGEVMVPVTDKWLIFQGQPNQKVNNIRFENIAFRYTNYTLPDTGFEPSQAAATVDAAIMLDYAENIEFVNCEFAHTGQHGIWFRTGVDNCNIEKCHFYDLGGGGIRIGDSKIPQDLFDATGNITVDNSILHSGGYNFPSAVGLWIGQSGDNTITHNDIADFRYTGVSVGWVWGYSDSPAKNNKITHNHIHHIGWALLSDMAAVYTLGKSEGTEVSHNVVHDIHAHSYGGWGLYTDEGSSYIKMENNLVYNTKTGGFHQHYGRENIIRNNVFAFADMYQVQATRVEDHLSFTFKNNIVIGDEGVLLAGPWKNIKVDMDHNCYWYKDGKDFDFVGLDFENWRQETGHDLHSIIDNPGVLDMNEKSFKINPDIVKQINFNVFDTDKVGVYGDKAWKQKALLDESIIQEFEEAVRNNREMK